MLHGCNLWMLPKIFVIYRENIWVSRYLLFDSSIIIKPLCQIFLQFVNWNGQIAWTDAKNKVVSCRVSVMPADRQDVGGATFFKISICSRMQFIPRSTTYFILPFNPSPSSCQDDMVVWHELSEQWITRWWYY